MLFFAAQWYQSPLNSHPGRMMLADNWWATKLVAAARQYVSYAPAAHAASVYCEPLGNIGIEYSKRAALAACGAINQLGAAMLLHRSVAPKSNTPPGAAPVNTPNRAAPATPFESGPEYTPNVNPRDARVTGCAAVTASATPALGVPAVGKVASLMGALTGAPSPESAGGRGATAVDRVGALTGALSPESAGGLGAAAVDRVGALATPLVAAAQPVRVTATTAADARTTRHFVGMTYMSSGWPRL